MPTFGDFSLDPGTQILRFDTKKLHAALNMCRLAKGLTWREVAVEIGGVSPAMLTHLAKGGRTGFPFVTRMTGWLGEPAARYTRLTPW